MSADGSITLAWGDGDHKFRLALGELRELQETINKPRVLIGADPIGPMSLLRLLRGIDAWPDEVREVLRIGLIGGGEKPLEAARLVKNYVDGRPLAESCPPAAAVLTAALVGVPDDIVGKNSDAEKTETEAETTALSSPPSTEPVPLSDGPTPKSTMPPSGNSPQPSKDGIAPMAASPSQTPQALPNSTP